MVIVFKSKEEMLDEIDFTEKTLDLNVSLSETPELYKEYKSVLPKEIVERYGLPVLPPEEKPEHMHVQKNWEEAWNVTLLHMVDKGLLIELAEKTGLRPYKKYGIRI